MILISKMFLLIFKCAVAQTNRFFICCRWKANSQKKKIKKEKLKIIHLLFSKWLISFEMKKKIKQKN